MRLLLDTHVLLWVLTDDRKLTKAARRMIDDAGEIFVSTASYWEIAVKVSAGKLAVDLEMICDSTDRIGIMEIPVGRDHVTTTLSLPMHHKDPFDRLIVATAMTEPMRLLTADRGLAVYSSLVAVV